MAYCRQEGKERIIFVTKEDHETPSNAELVADDPSDPYEEHGLILPNGDINWNCPCLGGMASGPCGEQFKAAFSCFHYSKEDVKGSDCVGQFRAMQECMQRYPDLYHQEEEEEEEEERPADPSQEAAASEASAAKEAAASVELMVAGALGSSRLQSPDEPLQESVFPSVVLCTLCSGTVFTLVLSQPVQMQCS
ncbi:hypothetical protein MG293_007305 [Ovis ammon polii]|uniref:Mitochondrial intermembrane space import and assembly protein 40 n=1 Tax=Ovis ammon polii TaxID=230172 RepID=A0AAD4UEF4_OVIAM|nr:hypothetical protein MG293_007305 [Ovis ammon polii]